MALVTDIQPDQQGGDLLNDAGIFQFSAINATHARNLGGEIAGQSARVGIVAADNHVAIERRFSVQEIGGKIVKGRNHTHLFGYEFGGLLRG
jgi:hypothetical protein